MESEALAGEGTVLQTPFGRIRIMADGCGLLYEAKPYQFTHPPVADRPIAGCYRISIPAEQYSTICCALERDDGNAQVQRSSGEDYDAVEFIRGQTILTIGAEDDNPAFRTEPIPDGIRYVLHEPIRLVTFGVAWADDYNDPFDNRTWFAADLTLHTAD